MVGIEELYRFHQISDGDDTGLGKSIRTTVSCSVRIRIRTLVIVAPHITIVTVGVNTVAAITVVATIFTPHAAAARIGLAVVLVTVGIDDRDKIQFPVVNQPGDQLVGAVIGDQVFHRMQTDMDSDRFAGVMHTVDQGTRLILGDIRIVRDLHTPDIPSLVGGADGITGSADGRIQIMQHVHLCHRFVEGVKSAHVTVGLQTAAAILLDILMYDFHPVTEFLQGDQLCCSQQRFRLIRIKRRDQVVVYPNQGFQLCLIQVDKANLDMILICFCQG